MIRLFLQRILLLSLLVPAIPMQAQMHVIDSLKSVVNSSTSDEKKMQAHILLGSRLCTVSFNETIAVADKGIELANKLKDSFALAELNRNKGIANYFKGDLEKAANLYYYAAGIYERNNKRKELAYVLNDIAKLYRKTRDLKRAKIIYDRSLTLFQVLKDSSGIQMILNESGVVYEYQGNYKEALRRYQASLQMANILKDTMGKSWCFSFIGGVYLLQNRFKEAEDYQLRALAIRQTKTDTFALALSYSDLGILYSTWGKYDRAKYYFDQSIFLAEKMQYKELLSNNYAEMSKMANMTGDYKTALDYFTWHTQLKDSLFAEQKTRQIEEISTIYETSKREQQISEQQNAISNRNLLLILAAVVIIVGLFIAWLLNNRYKVKQQLRLQTEIMHQQELAASAILEAEEKERTRIAQDLHDGVGQMMSAARMNLSSFYNNINIPQDESKSLSNIIKLVDDSCKEIRTVSHSMMPLVLSNKGLPEAIEELLSKINPSVLQTRFYNEGFAERPDSNTETILFRVIQECINNTLKHAEASHLDISIIKDKEGISVTIEDDGKGFDVLSVEDGMGLKNIQSRIQFLKGTVETDTAPGRGTSYVIHIPSQPDLRQNN